MPSDKTNQATVKEWEALGFFYDVDDTKKQWVFVGSCAGLRKFPSLLRDYISDSRHAMKAEHEHYGPYMYLKVVTLEEAEIGSRHIGGPLPKLAELAARFDQLLSNSEVGQSFQIGSDFCEHPAYNVTVTVKEEGFHPATADAELTDYIQRTHCLP